MQEPGFLDLPVPHEPLLSQKMRPAFGQTADTLSRLESSLPAQG